MPLDENPDQTDTPWPEIDRSLLRNGHPPPVPFPLEVLPDKWRAWAERSAQVFTPVDYYAQGLLGAAAAACGGGIVVQVTPQWSEPLLLWQALVGGSSSGKSPALAAARRLVDGIAAEGEAASEPQPEPPSGGDPGPAPASPVVEQGMHPLVAAALGRAPQAATLLREDLAEKLGAAHWRRDRAERLAGWDGAPQGGADAPVDCDIEADRLPRNIMGGLAPNRLGEVFSPRDEALAARFLYVWPEPSERAALSTEAADDDSVRGMLRRILGIGGTVARPGLLEFEAEALTRLEHLLPLVRERWRDAEGWEAAWLGKGAGTIVRLAGLLTLMHWA